MRHAFGRGVGAGITRRCALIAHASALSLFLLTLALTAPPAAAQNGDWTIVEMSGDAWVAREGVQNVSLTAGDGLAAGDAVATGPGGRVLLRRGENEILVAPNSAKMVCPH